MISSVPPNFRALVERVSDLSRLQNECADRLSGPNWRSTPQEERARLSREFMDIEEELAPLRMELHEMIAKFPLEIR